jgi:beta-lactamase class A
VRRLVLTLLLLGLPAAPAAAAPPPHWQPGFAAARGYAGGRAGEVSFALRTERRHWSYRGTTTYRSASVVKAMLLVAYLRRGDVRDRRLRAGERALLDPMIRRSDNGAADAVSARVGTLALAALARRAGMRSFLPNPVWGGSRISAGDQARFFLRIDRLMPPQHRRYGMRLLRSIIPEQRWGIADAVPAGWTIAFKGGWGPGVTQDVQHQVALLTNAGLRVALAVLTADSPSAAYGRETQRGIAARLLHGLGGEVVGEAAPRRSGLPPQPSSATSISSATSTP